MSPSLFPLRPGSWGLLLASSLATLKAFSADSVPGPQSFLQESARRFSEQDGLPKGPAQLVLCRDGGTLSAFLAGRWYRYDGAAWLAQGDASPANPEEFAFMDRSGQRAAVPVPWREVRQVLPGGPADFVITAGRIIRVEAGRPTPVAWRENNLINQVAVDAGGILYVASSAGLFRLEVQDWRRVEILDAGGRAWAARDVLGVGFDRSRRLWFATRAGVGCQEEKGWRFYEGKDGLPWNDFTGIAPGLGDEMWFATHWGLVRFDGAEWHYRQGPRWLPHDDVAAVALDRQGTAWCATAGGVGSLERRPMTLARKAEFYEDEIQRYIKRTPFGFVAEAGLRKPADRSSAAPQDSDNDGLWTAMYGAGECFAYGATRAPVARERARQAFEALRFLQKVTQGGDHAPPKGYVARTIRPADWPDPNAGRLAGDLEEQRRDRFWKVYEPRWPRSADGQWFWKSDTSSDELDGHYFFYPLYYDLCAETDVERDRVREVVRDLTDHLLTHQFSLIDHDGKPTRWGIYGPQVLNRDPYWWSERGLKSLSLLCYLSVATHVTGDPKYAAAARDLVEQHGYAQNAMFAKWQRGPGSGNQSDDEMAFMCYYGLLRCSADESLKTLIRYSFFSYWLNEAPEMNPFFNFAYAAHGRSAVASNAWGRVSLQPWPGWLDDSLATLRGFSLDRLDWPLHNSHRLDIVDLPPARSGDLDAPHRPHQRGYRVNGKVLPVENRHFNHWNTDPWHLDYGGNGAELAAGTVFLLPYYMGLYHGFIEKPAP
jgi:hypothetical protein